MNKDGEALCKYYEKVGNQLDNWPPIEHFTTDMEIIYELELIKA